MSVIHEVSVLFNQTYIYIYRERETIPINMGRCGIFL